MVLSTLRVIKARQGLNQLTRLRCKSTAMNQTVSSNSIALKEIPMLPLIGSLLPFYSGMPTIDPKKFYEWMPESRRRFGDFYKMGFPGLGKGICGERYVVVDPNEMMKVIRQEKTSQLPYPRGLIQGQWPVVNFFKDYNHGLIRPMHPTDDPWDKLGYWGQGETWKQLRTFMQTDLLSPHAAKGYIPAMAEAAKIASQAAPANSDVLNEYINRCAFDMFSSFTFGELVKTADLSSANPENIQFCEDSVKGLTLMGALIRSIPALLLTRTLGVKTAQFREMEEILDSLFSTAKSKYERFREKFEADRDSLTEMERDSYAARAIQRQIESGLEEERLSDMIQLMLLASVDTTSSVMAWNLYHVAVNQDVQERLYAEVSRAVAEDGGRITANVLKRSTCPYLHAVVRESHRLSPSLTIMGKENGLSDVEIHGITIPKDSFIVLDTYSLGIDPEFVEDPMEFRPERWLGDAVEARRGTSAEVIDHPYLMNPFSQGSRKCPGSRVANNEVLVLLSQLVLDWKISAPKEIKGFRDMTYDVNLLITPDLPKLSFEGRN